jgi:hypothetical protein
MAFFALQPKKFLGSKLLVVLKWQCIENIENCDETV